MSSDFFAKYPTRAAGLGIAVGEALKYVFSSDVTTLCSSFSCGYILCHAAYQGFQGRQGGVIVSAMFDSLIFDGFASYLIPTFVTYHMSKITFVCLKESITVPDVIVTWGPTVVGLCILSVTTETIDGYVNEVMNDTVRKFYV